MWPFKKKDPAECLADSRDRIKSMYSCIMYLDNCGFSDDVETIKDKIKYLAPSEKIEVKKADLKLLGDIRDFNATMRSKHSSSIDKQKAIILMNNRINKRNQVL